MTQTTTPGTPEHYRALVTAMDNERLVEEIEKVSRRVGGMKAWDDGYDDASAALSIVRDVLRKRLYKDPKDTYLYAVTRGG